MANIINNFKPDSILENTNCLVSYLPNGRVFAAKNIEESNLRKLFYALLDYKIKFMNLVLKMI